MPVSNLDYAAQLGSMRLDIARRILAEHHTAGWCDTEPEEVAVCRYAVVLRRDSDGWVIPCDTLEAVAHAVLNTVYAECEVEWCDVVLSAADGEPVAEMRCELEHTAAVSLNGHTVRVSA